MEAVRTPSPYLHPSEKPPAADPATPRQKPRHSTKTPFQPLDFNPATRASSTAADLRFTKVIGILRNH